MRLGRACDVTLSVVAATTGDAAAIAGVRNAASLHLTHEFGHGHWSGMTTETSVLRGINSSRVLVARDGETVVGTLRLATRRPWAIDTQFFAVSRHPLYLVDMAVAPRMQRRGVGRRLIQAALAEARGWGKDAIRLDAYDHPAGAGPFYEKCGFQEVGRTSFGGLPLVYYQLVMEYVDAQRCAR
jgi:GNAT superfamily N-acetyltransferase